MKVFNWIFSVFCILCLPAYGFHIGSILMCILGIVSLPVTLFKKKWEKLPKHKILRPFVIGFLFLAFVCVLPTEDAEPDGMVETSTESIVETEQIESTEQEKTAQEQETKNTESEDIDTESKAPAETEEVAAAENTEVTTQTEPSTQVTLSLSEIPEYAGKPYAVVNNNIPQFRETDLSASSYEYYSELDHLGRCGVVYACIGKDLMPTEERGEIGSVRPTGWHTVKYDVVDGKYLYNRCHLIAYQLAGENANVNNLITGTRYMNMEGMSPFENMVADYVLQSGNHVMYRVSPIYEGDNLLASGVQMEAKSVEDNGEGILFHVFCYNVQPGVTIDYASGDSQLIDNTASEKNADKTAKQGMESDAYIASNENSDTGSSLGTSENAGNTSDVPSGAKDSSAGSVGMVWKSATGSKYHSINHCGNMNPAKATQITEEQAISQGLGKCSKCW